ncbi:hypothetical protein DSUL_100207 [Desulfovibrionales bacterium]
MLIKKIVPARIIKIMLGTCILFMAYKYISNFLITIS